MPCNNRARILCDNPCCCPYSFCQLSHASGYRPGTIQRFKLCRYGSKCSDALCRFYHPNTKYKRPCPDWAGCRFVYCKCTHARKVRAPVCPKGRCCTEDSCRRLHPPNNKSIECSSMWTVLTKVPYLIEGFLCFQESQQLSFVSRDMNYGFSTNKKRVTRFYNFQNKYIKLTSLDHFGTLSAWVPFKYTSIFTRSSFSKMYISTTANYFKFLFDDVGFNSVHLLWNHFKEPQPDEWVVVANSDKEFVLEYSTGVNLNWQTRETLQALDKVDVCSLYGVWFTCSVVDVFEDLITIAWPWWYSTNGVVVTTTYAYPSAYIAHASTQAFDWRQTISVGSYLRHRNQGIPKRVHIVSEEFGTYVALCDPMFVIEFPTSLEDTTDVQLGPELTSYILSPAQFSVPRLDFSDHSCRTRVTYTVESRYDVPSISLLPLGSSSSSS